MQAQFVEMQYRASDVPQKFYDADADALFANGRVSAIDKYKKPLTKARIDAFIHKYGSDTPPLAAG